MSKMMLRSSGKPPLARSPIQLRPRRKPLQPTATNTIHTPPGSVTKSHMPKRNLCSLEESDLRPEYHTISYELRALAKMVHKELGNKDGDDVTCGDGVFGGSQGSPLFERGRFYDEYAARRNERLKRKKGEVEGYYEKKPVAYGLGVRVESAKKREAGKFDGRRRVAAAAAAAATPVVERREARTPRYSLRSNCKENLKPPLPMPMMMNVERSVGVSERKMGVRRIRKI